jgi:hypothetical protein
LKRNSVSGGLQEHEALDQEVAAVEAEYETGEKPRVRETHE